MDITEWNKSETENKSSGRPIYDSPMHLLPADLCDIGGNFPKKVVMAALLRLAVAVDKIYECGDVIFQGITSLDSVLRNV
jgi:hypothetical protein